MRIEIRLAEEGKYRMWTSIGIGVQLAGGVRREAGLVARLGGNQ